MSKSNLDFNIQTNTTGRLTPCLQQKIDKTRYLVEVHFSSTSTQSIEDKLKRVILHDCRPGKSDNTSLTSSNRRSGMIQIIKAKF